MEPTKKNSERIDVLSWSAFIGCMFIGGGVGMLFYQAGVGSMIGLGIGYIVSALIEATAKKEVAG